MSIVIAQTPAPAPAPAPQPVEAVCGDTAATDGVNIVCSTVYELIGPGVWQATLARVAGGAIEIVIILAVAFVALRLARRGIKRFVRRVQLSGVEKLGALQGKVPLGDTNPINLMRATQRTETIGSVLRSVATFAVSAIAFALILGVFGINLGPLIAGAGIVGVALGFGSQNLVRDFLSGIFMLLEDQYGVGDIIDVGEASGVVEAISLRTTRLRDVQGTVWYVPNGEIRRVGNKSQLWARAVLDLRVSYETDVPKAMEVIKQVADEVWHDPAWSDKIIEEPEVWGIEEFRASDIVIRLVLKVQPGTQWSVGREIRARLLLAFERAGVEIPDERTVYVRDSPLDGVEDVPEEDTPARTTPLTSDWRPVQGP
jgi:small-conductance mechanosensitive channel